MVVSALKLIARINQVVLNSVATSVLAAQLLMLTPTMSS